MRLLGLTDEQRLAIEEASGGLIKTEAAQIIIDIATKNAVEASQTDTDKSLKELQAVIGPHGAVTRLQAGGIRISRGGGLQAFQDGIEKTTLEPDGDFFAGSDITKPSTTTFCIFVNEQRYNNEDMGAGDLLIGDNSSGQSNVKYDASEGQLQFRLGKNANVYQDTDGSIKAAGGDVTIDYLGVWIENQTGSFGFKDTNGDVNKLYIFSSNADALGLINKLAGKAILQFITMTNGNTPYIEWLENPNVANATYFGIGKGAAGGRASFGADHFIDFLNTAGAGSATVYFNERGKDIDVLIKDAAGSAALKVDAGAGQVLVYGEKVVGAANGSAVLSASYNITAALGTYVDTGLSVTLPGEGTYEITTDIHAVCQGNAGTLWWIVGKLYNSTDGADVTNSETMIVLTSSTGTIFEGTAPLNMTVTVAASKTIKLYVFRNASAGGTFTLSQILNNAYGRTRMTYKKIG